jgi:hypothetical protein
VARAGGGQVVEMLSSWNSGSSRSLVNLAVCHGTWAMKYRWNIDDLLWFTSLS